MNQSSTQEARVLMLSVNVFFVCGLLDLPSRVMNGFLVASSCTLTLQNIHTLTPSSRLPTKGKACPQSRGLSRPQFILQCSYGARSLHNSFSNQSQYQLEHQKGLQRGMIFFVRTNRVVFVVCNSEERNPILQNPALLEAVPVSHPSLCNYLSLSHYRPDLYTRWKCWQCCSPRYEQRITYVLAPIWNDFFAYNGGFSVQVRTPR